jgi:hypothetical protein
MEWLYGDFEACFEDIAQQSNFKTLKCPLDPATNPIYGPSDP